MKKKLKTVAILSVIFSLTLPSTTSFAKTNVKRISGPTRYDVALKLSDLYEGTFKHKYAVVACGEDFKTSLYASYLASSINAPYFITNKYSLNKDIITRLNRLGIEDAYIIGNTSQISTNIEKNLYNIGINSIRIEDKEKSGDPQYLHTQIDQIIYNEYDPSAGGGSVAYSIIVNDRIFTDLASSIPLLSQLAIKERTYIAPYYVYPPGLEHKLIIGGTKSVPANYHTDFRDLPGLNRHEYQSDPANESQKLYYYTGRISGGNRYTTSIEIAKAYKPIFGNDIDTAIIVSGEKYPDALASAIASRDGHTAILLTPTNKLDVNVKKYIKDNNIKNIIIVGGELSVSKDVENELKSLK